jgi:hypothetical protein
MQVCLQMVARPYDPPNHEEVMGQGPHGLRMICRSAKVRSTEQSVALHGSLIYFVEEWIHFWKRDGNLEGTT